MADEVTVLIGHPGTGSRTGDLALSVADTLTHSGARQVVELAEVVRVLFGEGRPAADPFETVLSARLLVVATPAYKGSYTGLLKIFFDQFAAEAFAGIVAVPVVVAASSAHLAATSSALRDLLMELGAVVPAPPVAVLESRLAGADQTVARWAEQHAGPVLRPLAINPT